jgi:bile acid:Na+ symporter, BASS family
MKKIDKYKIALIVAILLLVIALAMTFTGNLDKTGPLFVLFFITMSIAVKGFELFKGLSFTMWMFTAVAAALFYPQFFVSYGDFKLTLLITPLLQIIMFGMGSQMSLNDFAGVIKMPKGVVIGVAGHYLIMPLLALLITMVFNFPPEVAAGLILVSCVPSGLASNVMSLLANANLALAVTIGAISTMLAPFITPFLMKIIGGQYISVDIWKMMLDIVNMMVFPIIAGFIYNLYFKKEINSKGRTKQMISFIAIILIANLIKLAVGDNNFNDYLVACVKSVCIFFIAPVLAALLLRYLLKGDQVVMKKILSLASQVGIAVIVTVITAAGRDSLLKVGGLLLFVVISHNLIGYYLGYYTGRIFGMSKNDSRTIAFEIGMPNAGLASGLALPMGNIGTIGLAPAIYGPIMNISGSTLASIWRTKPPKEDKNKAKA